MQMRNFLLRGPAGTGKTQGARAIAAGLNLPYMKYTCSASTEVFDFVGMVFPNTDAMSTGDEELDKQREILQSMGGINYANVAKLMNLPDLDDMDYDPAGVFSSADGRGERGCLFTGLHGGGHGYGYGEDQGIDETGREGVHFRTDLYLCGD